MDFKSVSPPDFKCSVLPDFKLNVIDIHYSTRFLETLFNICSVHSTNDGSYPRCELDSHADTSVAGRNTVLLGPPERTVSVGAFTEAYGTLRCDIGSAGTVWRDPSDQQDYLLVLHQALFFGDSSTDTLLNPNQMRANGLTVSDCPRQFDPTSTHSITVPQETGPPLHIPLELVGVTSGFESRLPTPDDIINLPRVELTGTATWDPSSTSLQEVEASISSVTVSSPDFEDLDLRYVSALKSKPLELSVDDKAHGLYEALIHQVTVTTNEELQAAVSALSYNSKLPQPGMIEDDDILFTGDPSQTVDPIVISAITVTDSKPKVTPEDIARSWDIGLATAKRTLQVTTQAGLRNVYAPSDRKVRLKAPWLKFPSLNTKLYGDAAYAKVRSIGGEKGFSAFTDGKGFDVVYPFERAKDYPDSLMKLIQQFGVPKTLVTDGGSEMQKGRGRATANEYRINLQHTVPYSPWQNKAEASIREIKRGTRIKLQRTKAPKRFWSYAAKWVAAIRRLTALDIPELEGRTPMERMTGSTPNITPYLLFDWYEDVYYHMPIADFPHEKRVLGKLIGVADNCTDELAFVVISATGIPMTRKSVWSIKPELKNTDAVQADITELNLALDDRFGDKTLDLNASGRVRADNLEDLPQIGEALPPPPPNLWEDDELIQFEEPDKELKDAEAYTPDEMDKYLNTELLLPHGEHMQRARVVSRRKDNEGNLIGTPDPNPVLDTREYEVQFPDGLIETVDANTIAENLYSQVDAEGRTYQTIKEVLDHRYTPEAEPLDEGYLVTGTGTRRKMKTTKGCEILMSFKDGTANWVPLKDIKLSNPVEVAEYAKSQGIEKEPCFNWWVNDTLRKRDRIIKKVKSRYWKRTHKYGVRLPHSVKEALEIDKATNTTFWYDAIQKELKNVNIAFEFMEDGKPPPGHKKIHVHMVFDIKSDLTRKARLVGNGNETEVPAESVFSSVVTRDSVRVAFTYAALNGLDILVGDIQNAYLAAKTNERCYFTAGIEFGQDRVGMPVKIVRALYGLRSSGARWRDTMAATLRDAGYQSCQADRDVWMRKNAKPDGTRYWEYILCYVDDILVISHEPQKVMDMLGKHYTLKPGSVGKPDTYLGTKIGRYTLADGSETWSMSSDLYVKRAVADVEVELKKVNQALRTKVSTPLSSDYRAELDKSPELDPKRANYFQGLIGVLRWIVELGRIDIAVAVSMLSRYLANPREGHLEEAFHMFAYLKRHDRSSLVVDPSTPYFDESRFADCDWSEYYPDACEPVSPKAPELLGESMTMTCFVDADHAGCRETRRSQSGVLIFLQKTPITWYTKRQNTVETSSYGSEFCAMRIAVELVESLRYKLRMMGIPIDGPSNIFCDNESVYKNVSRPESTLKKRHNAISYHRVREAVASGICRLAWEDGRFNPSDVLTKLNPGPKLRELIGYILY